MPARIPLPGRLREQAERFASGAEQPAVPRNAATVILVRGGEPAGLEAYLLRRVRGMAFAGGMAVFPGGGVDERDVDALEPSQWAGPAIAEWAKRLGVAEPLAGALVCAAVRETFEESGVLLAGPSAGEVVADTTGEDWEADRQALESRELAMSELLSRRGLVVRTDLLAPWSLWLTPEFEPRRYRTWFFLATLPDGQATRDVSTESVEVLWLGVAVALTRARQGDLLMLPPQYYTLAELYDVRTPQQAQELARARELEQVAPLARFESDEAHLELPERLVRLAEDVETRLDAGAGS